MRRIDNLQFCRDRSVLSGCIQARAFTKLTQSDCTFEKVEFELKGKIDAHGRAHLCLTIRGEFELTCQRCLEPLNWQLNASVNFVLKSGSKEMDLPDEEGRDVLPIEKQMNVEDLVEDQVILDMPMIPRHDFCSLPASS